MSQDKNTRPFGLQFVEEIPRAKLNEYAGGKQKLQTEALSISTHGNKDKTIEDQF